MAAVDRRFGGRSDRRLRDLRRAHQQALAAVILASPEYAELYQQLPQAWANLRTLRAILRLIDHEAHIPPPNFGRWQAEEPLDIGQSHPVGDARSVRVVAYEYDKQLLAQWQQALSELQQNANAPLPDCGEPEQPDDQ